MEVPDIELYATEAEENCIRIYRSDDAVFETRVMEEAEARIYPDDGVWYAKIRFPETEVEDAYNRMMAAAEDINEAYGTALDMGPEAFLERADEYGEVHLSEEGTAINYVEDTDLDRVIDDLFDEPSRSSIVKGALASTSVEVGGGSALGAGLGAAFGALGGPPGIIGGAAAGAAIGGGATGIFAALEGAGAALGFANPRRLNLNAGMPLTKAVKFFENRRKDRYRAIDAVEDHLTEVNNLHAMEQELEDIREMDLERHKELDDFRDSNIEDVHDVLMEVHFHQFEESEGATVVHEAGSYEEAADFITAVTGELGDVQDRPSLYASPEAFRTVFDRCTYTERGTTKYFDDAEILVENVYSRETVSREIVDWLEQKHRHLVQKIGRGRSMRR